MADPSTQPNTDLLAVMVPYCKGEVNDCRAVYGQQSVGLWWDTKTAKWDACPGCGGPVGFRPVVPEIPT